MDFKTDSDAISIFVWHIFQFIWQLDGQPITKIYRYAIGQYVDTNGDVITHLNITHVQTEDGGLYKCIASNSMGNVEYAARLNVYGKQNILVSARTILNIPNIACMENSTLYTVHCINVYSLWMYLGIRQKFCVRS